MVVKGPVSPTSDVSDSGLTLFDRTGRIGLELDPGTGLPVALLDLSSETVWRLPVALSLRLDTEGTEIERQPFGLDYADLTVIREVRLRPEGVVHDVLGPDELFTVATGVGAWRVDWLYRFRVSSPRLEVTLVVWPADSEAGGTLRNLHLTWTLTLPALADWRAFAPNSELRWGVSLPDIVEPIRTGDAAFGGYGMVVLDNPAEGQALLLWPLTRTEQTINHLQAEAGGAVFWGRWKHGP